MRKFTKALPVYSKKYINEMNISSLFVVDFKGGSGSKFYIAGENEYQVFLNGKLIGYGPAKAAHNFHRIDCYKLKDLQPDNRIVVILSGYNAKSFDRIIESPFIRYELYVDNNLVDFSSKESKCYLNETRYQKVTRFSYQRQFSESYNDKFDSNIFFYNNKINFKKLELDIFDYGKYLNRNVHYPKLKPHKFKLVETSEYFINENKKKYEDRYMYISNLIIFPKDEWEINPNDYVSQIDFLNKIETSDLVKKNQYSTYKFNYSITGFINLKIKVNKAAKFYVYFDETKKENKKNIEISFYRNTTHNIVSYELKEGTYDLVTFAPYSLKYAQVAVESGEIEILDFSVIDFENPDTNKFKYKFEDSRINKILKSAVNTFKANAVDILTDCPSRERAGWLCDSYFSGRSELLFTGKNRVEKNFLENYALYRYHGDIPRYVVPMCYPADFGEKTKNSYIPNWAMFYIIELRDYFNRRKDNSLLKKSIKNIKNIIKFLEKEENEFNLLEDLNGWVMVEWSHINDPESIRGCNIATNSLYASMLIAAGEILGEKQLINKGKKINEFIRKNAFNGTFFVDNLIRNENNKLVRNDRICETTQYYLFYFSTITVDEYKDLFSIMINKFGPNRDDTKVYPNIFKSNAFIGDYLRLEILYQNGLYQQVHEESVSYFYKMAKLTGTLWEHDSTFASLNHGFASFVANLIVYTSSGIKNIDFLNRRIVVDKSFKPFIKFDVKVPLEKGLLHIIGNKDKVDFELIGNTQFVVEKN